MTYWIARNSSNKTAYHSDKECHQLSQCDGIQEASDAQLEWYDECERCMNDGQTGGEGGREWTQFTQTLRHNDIEEVVE